LLEIISRTGAKHQSVNAEKPDKTRHDAGNGYKVKGQVDVNAACGAVCGESVCQRESGHTRKHRQDGVSWTDASVSAAKVKADKEEARLQKEGAVK
jgi:hypothetical protein